MLSLGIFNGRGGLSQAEIAVAEPDATEARCLETHVKRCALRFRLLAEGQNSLHSDIGQIKLLIIAIGGYLVLVSQPAQIVIGKLMGFLS